MLKETDEEWQRFSSRITFNAENKKYGSSPSDYVKVPFKEAASLIGKRIVFLHSGIAYVPIKELSTITTTHFRQMLHVELLKAHKHLP